MDGYSAHRTLSVRVEMIRQVRRRRTAVAFGLVIALWFKPQTAMAVTTLTMMALAMLGGLWYPLEMMPAGMQTIGRLLPSYWASQIGSWPLTGGAFPVQGVLVLGGWLVVLVGLGALGYRRAIRTSRR